MGIETIEATKPCMCPGKCSDKRCRLSSTSCCWCLDKRAEVQVTKFVDSIGMLGTKFIPRDIDYCSECRQSTVPFAMLVAELMEKTTDKKMHELHKDAKLTEKRVYRHSAEYRAFRRQKGA